MIGSLIRIVGDMILSVPWWLRLVLGLGCAAAGIAVCYWVNWRLGVIIVGIGSVFLMFSDPSDGERHGYHF